MANWERSRTRGHAYAADRALDADSEILTMQPPTESQPQAWMTHRSLRRSYADALFAEFESRIPDAAAFAEANRVLLLRTDDGFGDKCERGAYHRCARPTT